MNRLLTITCCFFLFQNSYALASLKDSLIYPEEGKPMPDFVLRNIKYYHQQSATLKDFRGKWLILDFWNKNCGSCVASFPHINNIQKELGQKVQLMLVGIQDPENEIQPMYAKFRERQNLVMPCAFDSAIAARFDIYATPYTILIDENGVVRSITGTLSVSDIKGFLNGNAPVLPKYHRMHDEGNDNKYTFDYNKPFLINNNGGSDTDFLFRSVLTSWKVGENPVSVRFLNRYTIQQGTYQLLGASLEYLYDCAYWGQSSMEGWGAIDTLHYGSCYEKPILEILDSSYFKYSYKHGKNIYSYSLTIPKSLCTVEAMKRIMQRDLESYFGYMVTIETRKCPYWRLVAGEDTKKRIRAKGGKSYCHWILRAGFEAKNWEYKKISTWLRDQISGYFVDETGITGNVDLTLDCIPTDFNDLQMTLKKNGFELVRAEKDMKALVIRDRK